MEVEYIWNIAQIKAYPTFADKTDVVCSVVWKVVATNGEYGSQIQGSIDLPTEYLEPFTPYNELTESQVLGWVKDIMGIEQVAQYENGALADLERLIAPPVVTLPLPWPLAPASPTDAQVEEMVTEPSISNDAGSMT